MSCIVMLGWVSVILVSFGLRVVMGAMLLNRWVMVCALVSNLVWVALVL